MRCVACGSMNLIEGTIPQAPKADLKFHPGGRTFKDRMMGGGRSIRAYGCLSCNHLQLAVEFEPGDVERHREFEGEQPTVLERLMGEAGAED